MTDRITRRARPDEVWAGLVAPVTRLADLGDGPQLCLPLAECYSIPVDCWIIENASVSAETPPAPRSFYGADLIVTILDADGNEVPWQ